MRIRQSLYASNFENVYIECKKNQNKTKKQKRKARID